MTVEELRARFTAHFGHAANVTLFPFTTTVLESELDRLEERLGPRKPATKDQRRHA